MGLSRSVVQKGLRQLQIKTWQPPLSSKQRRALAAFANRTSNSFAIRQLEQFAKRVLKAAGLPIVLGPVKASRYLAAAKALGLNELQIQEFMAADRTSVIALTKYVPLSKEWHAARVVSFGSSLRKALAENDIDLAVSCALSLAHEANDLEFASRFESHAILGIKFRRKLSEGRSTFLANVAASHRKLRQLAAEYRTRHPSASNTQTAMWIKQKSKSRLRIHTIRQRIKKT